MFSTLSTIPGKSVHGERANFTAKIGVDRAENEPCKVCPLSVYRFTRLKGVAARGSSVAAVAMSDTTLAAFSAKAFQRFFAGYSQTFEASIHHYCH